MARSTIYTTMGGAAGLVRAVAQDLLAEGGFEVLQQALALPDPRAAMRELLAAGLRLWATQRPVVRGMYALARVDADVANVVAELDAGQRAMFDTLATRLALPHATALLAVLGSFDTYELLARDFAMDAEQIIELLVTAADRAVR